MAGCRIHSGLKNEKNSVIISGAVEWLFLNVVLLAFNTFFGLFRAPKNQNSGTISNCGCTITSKDKKNPQNVQNSDK